MLAAAHRQSTTPWVTWPGDAVLRLVGDTVSGLTRAGDLVGRLGGDEFALLLPGAGLSEATAIADRLVTEVRTAAAPCSATVSVGAATVTCTDPVGLLAAADTAVHHAKHTGRDRACTPPVSSDRIRAAAPDGPRPAPLASSAR